MAETLGPPRRIYTIPPGRPFLRTLAEIVLAGDLPLPGGERPGPVALARMTLLMPTRRAATGLGEAFLTASGGAALLLPRIRPIADEDEDAALLVGTEADGELPPAVAGLERLLMLTQLVMGWSRATRGAGGGDPVAAAGATTPAQAAKLAGELARLMDMVETEGKSLAGLDRLVPEDYSAHWAQTLAFLDIVVKAWPDVLAGARRMSPALRRNAVIEAEARRLAIAEPEGPVIVAGVTGSIPSTVALMQAVAGLRQGAIVLPGLDTTLDARAAGEIAEHNPEHPQFGLMRLVRALGIAPCDVLGLPDGRGGAHEREPRRERRQLVAEAMRPAATLEAWQTYIAQTDAAAFPAASSGLHLVEAASAAEEAEIAALILRRVAEEPGQTAALVSPDRMLARRVVARLGAMGIAVDDSAGRPLPKTPPGAFLNLVVDAWSSGFAPVPTMALLKHPLLLLGFAVRDVRRAARALELIVFRAPYLGRGLTGLGDALAAAEFESEEGSIRPRAVRRLRREDRDAARALVDALAVAYAPLLALADAAQDAPLQHWVAAHVQVAEALAQEPAEPEHAETAATAGDTGVPDSPLWRHEAGAEAHKFFTDLLREDMAQPPTPADDYPELYRGLASTVTVRPRVAAHPRLAIWGPMEARLQQPDVVILGGLVDGTWPAAADPGPWLNRPMRAEMGLPSPEERIGQAAHDFAQLLGAPRVYLTRAAKVDGVPTVPSRWLMRLTALLDGARPKTGKSAGEMLAPDAPWQAWARMRDHAERAPPIAAPAPRPKPAWRPRKLPVTAIERWIANPYSIYAQHVLRLDPIEAIGGVPGAQIRGQIVHRALHRFADEFPVVLPSDVAERLLAAAASAMDAYAAHPRVKAFWLPRFERFARWFAETEPGRRADVARTVAEAVGEMVLDAPGGPFTLRARADRLDVATRGLVVTDYKTGRAPGDKRVIEGVSPQLPLEAAIALAGGFFGIDAPRVAALAYVRVSGGEPPGEYRLVDVPDPTALAGDILAGLKQLIADFDDPETPYRAVRRHAFRDSYAFDAYAHLARVAEWSAASEEGE